MGLQRPGCTAENRLFLTDAVNSVTAECGPDALHDTTYTPYGDAPDNDQLIGLLGFNGEVRERALGWSLLGRGYRAYNPGLMRFHSPDTASPELAGINPYVYCGANPVNWHDPSGHYGMRNSVEYPYIPPIPLKPKGDWRSWLGVALGVVFAVISFVLLPPVGLTMAFALGAASLAIDVASTATSVAALATGSEAAYDASFWLGTASALSTLGVIGYSRWAARGASTATSTGTRTASNSISMGTASRRGSSVASSMSRGVKRAGAPLSGPLAKRARLGSLPDTSPGINPTNTWELDWDVMPRGKRGMVRENPLYIEDNFTHSISDLGQDTATASQPMAERISTPTPSFSGTGSAIGAVKVGPLNWPGLGKYGYVPVKPLIIM
jgi:RHS repeat-associated protein